MRVETSRFGVIEVDPQSVIALVRGILGFEQAERFCLIKHKQGTGVYWLQSMDHPDLAFLAVDPLNYFPNYHFELADGDAKSIGLEDSCDAAVIAIVTVEDKGSRATINLAAPIVLNTRTRTGSQVVLQDGSYSIAEPVRLSAAVGRTGEGINNRTATMCRIAA